MFPILYTCAQCTIVEPRRMIPLLHELSETVIITLWLSMTADLQVCGASFLVFAMADGHTRSTSDWIESEIGVARVFLETQLPTIGDVLRACSWKRIQLKTGAKEPAWTEIKNYAVKEIMRIWHDASIPVKSVKRVSAMVDKYHNDTLQDHGLISVDDKSLVIDKTRIFRERSRVRRGLNISAQDNQSPIRALYFERCSFKSAIGLLISSYYGLNLEFPKKLRGFLDFLVKAIGFTIPYKTPSVTNVMRKIYVSHRD